MSAIRLGHREDEGQARGVFRYIPPGTLNPKTYTLMQDVVATYRQVMLSRPLWGQGSEVHWS